MKLGVVRSESQSFDEVLLGVLAHYRMSRHRAGEHSAVEAASRRYLDELLEKRYHALPVLQLEVELHAPQQPRFPPCLPHPLHRFLPRGGSDLGAARLFRIGLATTLEPAHRSRTRSRRLGGGTAVRAPLRRLATCRFGGVGSRFDHRRRGLLCARRGTFDTLGNLGERFALDFDLDLQSFLGQRDLFDRYVAQHRRLVVTWKLAFAFYEKLAVERRQRLERHRPLERRLPFEQRRLLDGSLSPFRGNARPRRRSRWRDLFFDRGLRVALARRLDMDARGAVQRFPWVIFHRPRGHSDRSWGGTILLRLELTRFVLHRPGGNTNLRLHPLGLRRLPFSFFGRRQDPPHRRTHSFHLSARRSRRPLGRDARDRIGSRSSPTGRRG